MTYQDLEQLNKNAIITIVKPKDGGTWNHEGMMDYLDGKRMTVKEVIERLNRYNSRTIIYDDWSILLEDLVVDNTYNMSVNDLNKYWLNFEK